MPAKGARYAAKQSGHLQYISTTPCPHGHGVVKYTSTGRCVTCHGVRPDEYQFSMEFVEPAKPRPYIKGRPRSKNPSANTLAARRYKEKNKEFLRGRRNVARERETRVKQRRNLSTWPNAAIHSLRRRAKVKGLAFDITVEDISVPEFCPVLGIPLIAGIEAPDDNRPSVDRVDNSRGYTRDNICVISRRANLLKNQASLEEVRLILKYMESNL